MHIEKSYPCFYFVSYFIELELRIQEQAKGPILELRHLVLNELFYFMHLHFGLHHLLNVCLFGMHVHDHEQDARSPRVRLDKLFLADSHHVNFISAF